MNISLIIKLKILVLIKYHIGPLQSCMWNIEPRMVNIFGTRTSIPFKHIHFFLIHQLLDPHLLHTTQIWVFKIDVCAQFMHVYLTHEVYLS